MKTKVKFITLAEVYTYYYDKYGLTPLILSRLQECIDRLNHYGRIKKIY